MWRYFLIKLSIQKNTNMKTESEIYVEAEMYAKTEKEKRLFGQRVSRCISTEEFQTEAYIAAFLKCQKEYEEKLRWIPVEEKLPEKENKNGNLSSTSKVVQVKSINFSEPFCAFYNYVQKCWVSYPYLSGSEIHGITSWRSFL